MADFRPTSRVFANQSDGIICLIGQARSRWAPERALCSNQVRRQDERHNKKQLPKYLGNFFKFSLNNTFDLFKLVASVEAAK